MDRNKLDPAGPTLAEVLAENYGHGYADPRLGMDAADFGTQNVLGLMGARQAAKEREPYEALSRLLVTLGAPFATVPQGALGANALRHSPPMKEYRSSWRADYDKTPSTYSDEFFSLRPEILRSEQGKPLAYKSQLVPKRDIVDENVIAHSPDLIHRGMSHAEYQNILRTGLIQSRGGYNIGPAQEGLTYFTTRPASAASYASSFAPSRYKPEPGRDAYVVSVRRPTEDRIRQVAGTDPSEVGVLGSIPISDLAAIYRGRVIAHTPEYRSPGFRSTSSSRLNWEKLEDGQ